MNRYPIYLVAGPSGSGKTTWIHHQIATRTEASAYLCLGAGDTQIDSTYMSATCERLVVAATDAVWTQLAATQPLYVEIAPQLDLAALKLPIEIESCHKIAIVPSGVQQSEWHDWATETFVSSEVSTTNVPLTASPRWVLTGEVLDPASLNLFWDELIQGAYGTVARAKAIFEVVNGRSMYFSFGLGYPECTYLELPLPPITNGRPTRFSGLEIVGDSLQIPVIMETLQDCCLDDRALDYYQQQLRSQLPSESPVEVLI
jgi:hypothetical protein